LHLRCQKQLQPPSAKCRDQASASGRDQSHYLGNPPAVELAPAGGDPEGSARVASPDVEAKHLLEGLATHSNSATLEGLATQTKSAEVDSTDADLGDARAFSADAHHHLFGNVTTISERVRVFLDSSCTEFGSMSFVETHASREEAPKLSRLLKKSGFVSSQANASSGTNHGTKGGAVTAVRPHLECSLKAPSWAAKGTRMKGHDWVAAVHRFGKVSIVIFSAYFHTGHGTETINNTKFNQILRTKRSLGLPSILVADFNCTPSQVEAKLWTRLFEGFLLVPKVSFTCTSGDKNRILDFALVSFELQGIVTISPDFTTPWGPHIGLLISILKKANTVLANQCRMPKELPSLKVLRKNDSFQEIEVQWDPRRWGVQGDHRKGHHELG